MSWCSDPVLATGSDPRPGGSVARTERRTPKQERAQATVDAIVEAAARILVEEGWARLSTNRVAERAGVSVGTLYQYFRDKEAIVETLVDRIAEQRIEAFGARVMGVVGMDGLLLDEALELLVDGTLAAMRIRSELARRLLLEAPRGGRLDLEREWRRRCTDVVRAAMYRRNEHVRPGNHDLMAHVIVTGCFAVLQDALAYRPELLEGPALRTELLVLARGYLKPPVQ
jgi:AcrR family transcriptional regulator